MSRAHSIKLLPMHIVYRIRAANYINLKIIVRIKTTFAVILSKNHKLLVNHCIKEDKSIQSIKKESVLSKFYFLKLSIS